MSRWLNMSPPQDGQGRLAGRILLGVMGAVALAGCLSDGGRRTYRVSYVCEGGQRLEVLFQPNMARILSERPPIEMIRRPTGRGFWFESATHSIRGEGRRMRFTVGRMAPVQCREIGRR